MKSRHKVIGATFFAVLFFVILFKSTGYEETWHFWNIPTMSPHFADIRVITHAAESRALGLDPMVENPADPWQRPLNYPYVWQLLFLFGINQDHTTFLGIVVILSFLVGICLLLPNASNGTLAIVFAAVLSPAALLGMERGNIDLFLFFLTVLSVIAAQRSPLLSAMLVFGGFMLKLFPIFGWVVLGRMEKPKFIRFTLIALGLVVIHLFVTLQDIMTINEATPRGSFLSYGVNVFWMSMTEINPDLEASTKLYSRLFAFVIMVFAFSFLLRKSSFQEKPCDPLSLDAFRAGSAIYVGTFLLGNNWDYRQVFLILTMPQLISWTKSRSTLALVSKALITAMLIAFWHMIIVKQLRPLENGYQIGFIIDELANWLVFGGLAFLLAWSAPAWLKESLRNMNSPASPPPLPTRPSK